MIRENPPNIMGYPASCGFCEEGDRRGSNPPPSLESQSRMMHSSVSPTFAWIVVKLIANNTTTHVEHTAPTVDS